ncbi:MAG: S8 family peptidase [Pseudomonadota bacterium]
MAAQALGLEWLGSQESDDEGNTAEEDDTEAIGAVLYLTMPSLKGLKSLLAQWNRYKRGESCGINQQPLWAMFGYLSDLRVWSEKDRIDPNLRRYIDTLVELNPDLYVQVELDFWYRNEKERRDNSIETLRHLLVEVNGTMLDLIDISEIRYQGALISLPSKVAKQLSDGNSLTRFDDIMTIRPQSLYSFDASPDVPVSGPKFPDRPTTRQCITALLDGYPVSAHAALANRISIHEVDVTSEDVPAASRNHGTAMASLIIHGDLQTQTANGALERPVALIPVLAGLGNKETTPKGKLPIGVIYRALKTLVESRETPALAKITVVNHSICDTYAPFVRRPSPWATLLDHFSYNHQLLFIISAGNITESFPVSEYADLNEFNSASPVEREAALLNAINGAKATRGIFSPAEAINGVTVGALHIDGSVAPKSVIDPYPTLEMTNLASATGFGVNRSLKPDLVEQGGRFSAGCSNTPGGGIKVHAVTSAGLGHQVASPSITGDLTHVTRTAGTSNAAAMVTRACNQIADAVEDAFKQEGANWLDLSTRAVILKTLLAHGTSWGEIGDLLNDVYPPQDRYKHAQRKDNIAKFLGYGRPNLKRVISGADNRITLLADDHIVHDKLHEYRLPIPSAMINNKELRSVTLTLGWSTPIISHSVDYRSVVLKLVNSEGKNGFWKGVDRQLQPYYTTGQRGTLIHIKLEGKNLVKVAEQGGIFVGVQAMSRHPSQNNVSVPYALAATLEMGQSLKTGIFNEVQQEIKSRTRAANRIGTKV